MKKSEYLLICLAEEASEVIKDCSKSLRFGLDEIEPGQSLSNRRKLADEIIDLVSVIELISCEEIVDLPFEIPYEVTREKRNKIERFQAVSIKCGTLEP